MIAGLRGTVYQALTDAILLDVGGVVYRVYSSAKGITEAGAQGGAVYFHTHLVVREDALILFGFTTELELLWFDTLITVNGVGPRLAQAVLSKLSPEQITQAIATEDLTLLSTVPGVGKRTASRILLDLRGKIPQDLEAVPGTPTSALDNDTIAALRSLGYSAAEAQTAVGRMAVEDDATPEERILTALRNLGTPT